MAEVRPKQETDVVFQTPWFGNNWAVFMPAGCLTVFECCEYFAESSPFIGRIGMLGLHIL